MKAFWHSIVDIQLDCGGIFWHNVSWQLNNEQSVLCTSDRNRPRATSIMIQSTFLDSLESETDLLLWNNKPSSFVAWWSFATQPVNVAMKKMIVARRTNCKRFETTSSFDDLRSSWRNEHIPKFTESIRFSDIQRSIRCLRSWNFGHILKDWKEVQLVVKLYCN